MVVEAGADIVDINFGCPVRKVTKTGAGASALEDHGLAVELAGAVVDAVDVPVTVKMRRGLRNGSRAALELGPKLEQRGVASLTLHPRSAQQMYTGTADHTLTRELVERVSIPVIASGDIGSHARAEQVLDETGAAAVMVGRGAQGRPWTLRELAEGAPQQPDGAELVAELVRFMREVVREMGDERSVGFLRKFYGWYLRGTPGAKELRARLTQAPSVELAEALLLDACPEALPLLAEADARAGAAAGVGHGPAARPADLDLRRRLKRGRDSRRRRRTRLISEDCPTVAALVVRRPAARTWVWGQTPEGSDPAPTTDAARGRVWVRPPRGQTRAHHQRRSPDG